MMRASYFLSNYKALPLRPTCPIAWLKYLTSFYLLTHQTSDYNSPQSLKSTFTRGIHLSVVRTELLVVPLLFTTDPALTAHYLRLLFYSLALLLGLPAILSSHLAASSFRISKIHLVRFTTNDYCPVQPLPYCANTKLTLVLALLSLQVITTCFVTVSFLHHHHHPYRKLQAMVLLGSACLTVAALSFSASSFHKISLLEASVYKPGLSPFFGSVLQDLGQCCSFEYTPATI